MGIWTVIVGVSLVAFALVAGSALAEAARAATPPLFWQVPEDATVGEGAGQLDGPRGVAVDATTGHVYVYDPGNSRIDEFDAWGQFVEAWGWGVRDGRPEAEVCTAATGCQQGIEGDGAGQIAGGAASRLAVDAHGAVYVYERLASQSNERGNDELVANLRVQKFDSNGNFVAMWGGDVVFHGPDDSGIDEEQEVTVAAAGGGFRLGLPSLLLSPGRELTAAETPELPFDADAEEVEDALDALSTVGGLGGSVTVSGGPGGPYKVTFEGDLAGDDVPQLTISHGVGSQLSCSTSAAADTVSYQWLRSGKPIAGADTQIYTTVQEDAGQAIQCQVTALNANAGATQLSNPAQVVSPSSTVQPPTPPATITAPVPSAPLTVGGGGGQTLTCDPDSANWPVLPYSTSLRYSWYRNGELIAGVRGPTYQVSAADVASPAVFQCVVGGSTDGLEAAKASGATATDPPPSAPAAPVVDVTTSPGSFVTTVRAGGGPEICKASNGDVCKAGVPGTAPGQFGPAWLSQTFEGEGRYNDGEASGIAIGPSGNVFVGDVGRIQEFSPDGGFEGEVKLPGETVASLAMNGEGDFYVAPGGNSQSHPQKTVLKLSPSGGLLQTLSVNTPGDLAVDPAGNLYAIEEPRTSSEALVVEFDPDGNQIISPSEGFAKTERIGNGFESLAGLATSTACGNPGEDLFVSRFSFFTGSNNSYLQAYGPPPDPTICPPPALPPTVVDQYAASVGVDGATLAAKINPHFWTDTRFYVEYGTGKCSEGGCAHTQPTPPGSSLTNQVIDSPITSSEVFLTELEPGTTYHYRFVAQSSGGGPSRGSEGTFTTFSPPREQAPCPNEEFRGGAAARLPDCRAYEMVSPVDKEGGDAVALHEAGFNQAAQGGDGLAYTSYRSFGDTKSAPYNTQYIATRTPEGWRNEAVSPPRGLNLLSALGTLKPQFKLFSPDLCTGWLVNDTDSVLAANAALNTPVLYRREDCGSVAGGYAALAPLTTAPPRYREQDQPELQGVSRDGEHAIFRVPDRLTNSEPDLGFNAPLLYESFGSGEVRPVCVLPNGSSVTEGCSAGTGGSIRDIGSAVSNAISADGSRIFWSDFPGPGEGQLYVRINGKSTRQITTEPAQFWTAAASGDKVIYSTGARNGGGTAELFEYDVDRKSTRPIAAQSWGVLGASDDAELIYFTSAEVFAGGAVAGAPNLYLYNAGEGGRISFVATLARSDVAGGSAPFLTITSDPSRQVAQVSPDGERAVFMSRSAALAEATAGYDNTDLVSGEADAEVYAFDAVSGELDCVSCDPTGARPTGRSFGGSGSGSYWAAARIPAAENQLYRPRSLSTDGRVFFESFGALTPSDTNGQADVYEWEPAGVGTCTPAAPGFHAGAGGCVSLISSGRSAGDSRFVDAGADGNDVFFTTGESLVPQDPGLTDIYDARVQGGLPSPPTPVQPCLGEACQGQIVAPSVETPASSAYQGPGNVKEGARSAKRCPKGTHRVRRKCVRKRRHRRRCFKGKQASRRRCMKGSKRHRARRAHHGRRAAR